MNLTEQCCGFVHTSDHKTCMNKWAKKILEFEKGKHKKESNNEEKIAFYIFSEIRHIMTPQVNKFYIIWTVKQIILLAAM